MVTFVVPSWNGRELLGPCLASIAAEAGPGDEVIVVDDGSTDDTAAYLEQNWPEVTVVRHERNMGFAAAVNSGVAAARGELIALVNNDVELGPGWLERSRSAIEADPGLGSVATKLLDGRGPGKLDGAGDALGWDGYAARRGRGKADDGTFDEPAEVISACAAAALYRRAAWEQVGGFDARFFAYLEDVDWGLRAQLAGWRCRYEPTAAAIHTPGSTSGAIKGFELYHAHRNMIWLIAKSYPPWALVAFAPLAFLRRLASLVKAIARGNGLTVLRAWRDGLRQARQLREQSQAQRAAAAPEWPRVRKLISPIGRSA